MFPITHFSIGSATETECFGIHLGGPQQTNLGDGRGWVNQTAVIRFDYNNTFDGTCLESLTGGNHFRFWQQTTTEAFFIATSVEEWAGEEHTISPNGYDRGRDEIVEAAVSGIATYECTTYNASVLYIAGLLQAGSEGINHNITFDGLVALLTIHSEHSSEPCD